MPNDVTADYSYDALNRLTDISHLDSSQQVLASYGYGVCADGMRRTVTEAQKLPSGATENHNITYSYDNLNRLTYESADDGTSNGYDISYEYDLVGNRTQRIVTANGATLTTTYTYDPNTDRLQKEEHDGPIWAMEINNQRYYAYADSSGGKITYRGKSGEIGQFEAFLMGLPTPLDNLVLIVFLALLPATFVLPWMLEVLGRLLRSPPNRQTFYIKLWKRCLSVLLAYMILLTPCGLQGLAHAAITYSELDTRQWAEGDTTIEYYYDENGSTIIKYDSQIYEGTTYDYNLQNRLETVTHYSYENLGGSVDDDYIKEVTEPKFLRNLTL